MGFIYIQQSLSFRTESQLLCINTFGRLFAKAFGPNFRADDFVHKAST